MSRSIAWAASCEPTRASTPAGLINISVGDAGIVCAEPVEVGELIIAYFDEIGRIEGPVVRLLPGGGFAMLFELDATPARESPPS